jgi:hypothetical protein
MDVSSVDREDAPIEAFSFAQLPALMVANGHRKQLRVALRGCTLT